MEHGVDLYVLVSLTADQLAGHGGGDADSGDVLDAIALLGITEANALHPLPDGEQGFNEVNDDGKAWGDQGPCQGAEELAIQRHAEAFVIQPCQVIDILPGPDGFTQGIVFVVWNVVTDRPAFEGGHAAGE